MRIGELRFLAVEDHAYQRSVLMRMLASLGATQICGAADGSAALKILKTSAAPIDIIISDLDMPGMDGMEFIRHLGEARVAASIILASALESVLLASVETMSKAYGVRILGVIEKPITRAKLDALIGLHRPIQPLPPKTPGPSFTLEEITQGLARDEFEPFFQPKIDLATGRVAGAEALARWRHPQLGVVAPSAFIGLLEAGDRIDALTWCMLEKSAAVCRQWRAKSGLELAMSVNLSIKSLADVYLADRVTALVRAQELHPRHMVLEITESAATTDVGKVLENLSRLRMKGFGLSIDDYGTGYSSMQQLMRIAFTELKIDRSFVANAARQPSASVILESSLDMAKKLNITSVAEGVESQQDWDLLVQLGCKLAQGYFVAKPMQAQALLAWKAMPNWKGDQKD